MKLAIFALLCALHLVALTCAAAIFENAAGNYADASQAGYAYAAPSKALLYPSNVPSAPNRAGFEDEQPQYGRIQDAPQQQLSQDQHSQSYEPQQQQQQILSQHHFDKQQQQQVFTAKHATNEQLQYGRIQDAPQQQLSQELHTRNDEAQQPLIQQQFDKQQQQEVLTAKGVAALQAVAFSSHATEPKEKVVIETASHNGYDYNRPGTAFEYPNDVYELGDPIEVEQNFQHQEVASKHKSDRRGPVKRLRLNKSPSSSSSSVLRVNAVSTCNEHTKHWKTVVSERSLKRPPGRRLFPYTETLVDESYLL